MIRTARGDCHRFAAGRQRARSSSNTAASRPPRRRRSISPRSRSRPPTSATASTCSKARAATSRWRVAKDGIIMVDGEFAPLHDKIKAAISAVSNLPIKYLINTHFHGDHTGGNEPFAKDGVTIVSQVNVKNRLAAGTTNGLTGAKTPPARAGRAADRRPIPALSRSGCPAASPTSSISPTPIPTATPMSGSRPPTCCRPATPSPTAAIPTSTSPMAATSRA